MSKESTLEVINQSMYTLMDFSRKSRGPIKGFRMRDLHSLKFIYIDNVDHRTTMSNFAKHMNITPAAASQIIAGYEKNDWVKRVRSENDRRTVYIEISDTIKSLLKQKWDENQNQILDFLDALGDEDCDNLERILKKVIAYLEEDNKLERKLEDDFESIRRIRNHEKNSY